MDDYDNGIIILQGIHHSRNKDKYVYIIKLRKKINKCWILTNKVTFRLSIILGLKVRGQ